MIYESHLAAAERAFWRLEDIRWQEIDREAASTEIHIHKALHDAALIEGYLPVYASHLMHLLWEDVDATAVLSLELFEGLRHYTALKHYLDAVGFQASADADTGLAAARGRARDLRRGGDDIAEHLTHFMGSEFFAAHFFHRFADETREPVLSDLLRRMSADEFRHAAAGGAVLEALLVHDPSIAPRVLAAAAAFRHYGSDIVEVPVAERNDFEAIVAFNRKVNRICGLGGPK